MDDIHVLLIVLSKHLILPFLLAVLLDVVLLVHLLAVASAVLLTTLFS